MSVCRKLPDGTIQKIAGHTILLDANVSEIREGIINIPALDAGSSITITVTFTDPMPDIDYIVIFDNTSGGSSVSANCSDLQRTVNGFIFNVQNVDNSSAHTAGTIHYHAFKLVKIEGYAELQNKVNNPDEVPTEGSQNLVKSGGVWEAIKNASSVFVGTEAEWEAADHTLWDIAVLTDKHMILSVNRTNGETAEQANLNKIFRGTQAEWDALPTATQDWYEEKQIIDDQYIAIPGTLIVAHDMTIATGDWVADDTYTGFGFKADISVAGVTAKHSPEVRFSFADANSGKFAGVADCANGKVTVYANAVPDADITIPVIICTLMEV